MSENTMHRGDPESPRRRTSGSLTKDAANLLPTPTTREGRNKTSGNGVRQPGKAPATGSTIWDIAFSDTWGNYAGAVARHAMLAGTMPPEPVDENRRLNPAFVEWMMLIPSGWVTALGFPRASQLRILGNGVVPVQAATAYYDLLTAP